MVWLNLKSTIVSDLEQAGFVLNITMSRLKPEQVGAWLGFTLDLREGKFLVPEDKVARLVKSIDGILASSTVHVQWLASAVGQIISMSLAIGQVTRLRTRALYAMINSRQSWADRLCLSKDAREELVFWKSCLLCFNGRPIWFSPGVT